MQETVVQTSKLLKDKDVRLDKLIDRLKNLNKEVLILRDATKSDVEVAKRLKGISIVSANMSFLEEEKSQS